MAKRITMRAAWTSRSAGPTWTMASNACTPRLAGATGCCEMATMASRAQAARMKPAMRVTNWPDEWLEGREEDGFTGGKTARSASWLQESGYGMRDTRYEIRMARARGPAFAEA